MSFITEWCEAPNLFHIRGGKVARWVFYWDRSVAFSDCGLIPEGDTAD
jgi:hypothetical protein